jgi:hypothetical protein
MRDLENYFFVRLFVLLFYLCFYLFSHLFSLIFKMCIQRDPYNWSEAMYERYTNSILDYLLTKVKISFDKTRSSYDVAFLKEWKTRWNNQKLIVQGLSKLFMYLVTNKKIKNIKSIFRVLFISCCVEMMRHGY